MSAQTRGLKNKTTTKSAHSKKKAEHDFLYKVQENTGIAIQIWKAFFCLGEWRDIHL